MTPTSTGATPQLYVDAQIDDPRTKTVAYGRPAMPAWIGDDQPRPAGAALLRPGQAVDPRPPLLDLAEQAALGERVLTAADAQRLGHAVADLTARVEHWQSVARRANQRALEAVAIASDCEQLATIAQARLEVARRLVSRPQRPGSATLEAAIDRVARAVTGRSHAELAADLDREVAQHPDDEDTIVVEPPLHARTTVTPEEIAYQIAAARAAGYALDPLVALADLLERWVAVTREIRLIEAEGARVPIDLLYVWDQLERELARAVQR